MLLARLRSVIAGPNDADLPTDEDDVNRYVVVEQGEWQHGINDCVGELRRDSPLESHCDSPCDFKIVTKEMLTRDDIVIVLIGPVGSRKGDFMKAAVDGQSLEARTNAIQAIRITLEKSVHVVLVNTPGFDDTHKIEDTLEMISDWFTDAFKKGVRLSRILYFLPISDGGPIVTPSKDLEKMKILCEEETHRPRRIPAVGTACEGIDSGASGMLEKLIGNCQPAMPSEGLQVLRFEETTPQSAWSILNHAITQELDGRVSRIQNDLANLKKNILTVQIGQQNEQWIARQEDALNKLREGLSNSANRREFVNVVMQLRGLHGTIAEMHRFDPSWIERLRRLNEMLVGWVFHNLLQARNRSTSARRNNRNTLWPLISSALADHEQRTSICALMDHDAEHMATYLNMVLHDPEIFASDEGKKALSLLCNLVGSAHVHPRCYSLKGIKYDVEPIGGGRFADVYKGQYEEQTLGLKVFRVFGKRDSAQVLMTLVKEIVLSVHLSHQNILPFYGVHLLNERICFVSPWMNNGNIRSYLHQGCNIPRMLLLLDIVSGLVYLHRSSIVHGNLKVENVLISDEGRALLTDSGMSSIAKTSKLVSTTLPPIGAVRWKAPELFRDDSYPNPTQESDIWSFSCLCYEILSGKLPFYQYNSNRVISVLLKGTEIPARPLPGDGGDVIDDKMWGIMTSCWNYRPQDRPISEVVQKSMKRIQGPDKRPQGSAGGGAFWKAMRAKSEAGVDYGRVKRILHRIQGEEDGVAISQ